MNQIDLEALREKAQSSSDGEAFIILRHTPEARLGIGVSAKPNEPFIEINLHVFDEGILNIDRLENRVQIIRALVEAGYTVIGEGNTGVTCERKVNSASIDKETQKLGVILGWS